MTVDPYVGMSRRAFLAASGGIVVAFACPLRAAETDGLPGSLRQTPRLDAWIGIGADGNVVVCTGKAELGQGVKTALIQLAAEELRMPPARITLVTADTARTPNEGYTAGSQSMSMSGTAIVNAAAQAREALVALAATRFGLPANALSVADGAVRADDGRSIAYASLLADQSLAFEAKPSSPLREPSQRQWIGRSMPRVDIPAKVTGGAAYVHDLRLPGMLHARVVRPPRQDARLVSVDVAAVRRLPGVVDVVRDGSFLAVVAEREFQAVQAMRALARAARWSDESRTGSADPYAALLSRPSETFVIRDAAPPSSFSHEATYRRPYQMHGSIGPSCAVAQATGDGLTVWTHTQGVYPLRGALAEMLRMPPSRVRCIHVEGAGCYGHNGADDVAADAAVVAVAVRGRPVRVQWMRDQEHAFEPLGSPMVATVRAALGGDGVVTDWHYEVVSGPHSTRPGRAGNLLAARHLANPYEMPAPRPIPQPEGGGDRNAIPLYAFPNVRVAHRFVPELPLRVSALRSLGAYVNVFAIESFVDELAAKARADPVQFRLRHLDDPRARDVLVAAADRFGWSAFARSRSRGRGIAFARYKNLGAYAAVAIEAKVDRTSGRIDVVRAVAAVDSGDAINPDGIRNQIEGGIVQSLSWTLYESVAFEDSRVASRDWNDYPILRFASAPGEVDVRVFERPGAPFLGTGEAAQGPTAAALANAIADATGVRLRDLPFTAARVRQAMG